MKRKAMGNEVKRSEQECPRKAPRKAQESSLLLLLFSQLNSADVGMTGGGQCVKSEV